MCALANRHGEATVYFKSAYPTWKLVAARHGRHIAPGTCVWIPEDGSKHYRADTFRV